ncbi:MAG TPA: hypothetical protein PKJ99_14415 [Thermoanaerobaculales bacterium]|nr:hypothetical protein [Thermoanaerobaculales bacterium]HPA80860.1 hypothetical protein [Thermoanaerobaculales bacterium]HQL30683.1 hypothetical protein [Thermoanaerobaculales bacterium]HQN96660.1 hypothetical protein [Thermoanaerobaculales bacterium]
MIRRLGAARSSPPGSLASVLERAVADGAPEPSWAAVEDPAGAWLHAVAALPAAERARGVVAVTTEEALVLAARLGVGGALWLPPSLAGAMDALQAAAAPVAPGGHPDVGPVDMVAAGERDLIAVSWARRAFWRRQLGEPEMAALLAALADVLGVLPAVVPWPALVMPAGPAEVEIEAAWRRVTGERQLPSEGAEVIPVGRPRYHGDIAAAAMRALLDHVGRAPEPSSWSFPRPVHELPSGRRVGWWSPGDCDATAGEGEWVAVPAEASEVGFHWRLRFADGGESEVVDALGTPSTLGAALRVPGWFAGGLAAGRPIGLLASRLAVVAQRLGLPLWVPNARPDALAFLLRLPGALWVDGSAVPAAG